MKKYFISAYACSFVLGFLMLAAIYITDSFVWRCVIALGYFLFMRPMVIIVANISFLPILKRDLDAKRFEKTVFSNRMFVPRVAYHLLAALYTGDYQKALNICAERVRRKKLSSARKASYYEIMARIYFEMGDLAGLQEACDAFDALVTSARKKEKKMPSLMEYYHAFLKGDYDACLAYCDKWSQRKSKNRLAQVNLHWHYACAYEGNGDLARAEEHFLKIVSMAPKLFVCQVAQKRLAALGTEKSAVDPSERIRPEDGYELYDDGIKRRQVVKRLLVLACLIFIVMNMTYYNDPKEKAAFEEGLYHALNVEYGSNDTYEIVDYFTIKTEDAEEVLCLVDANGFLDVWSCVTDTDRTINLTPYIKKATKEVRYSLVSPTYKHRMRFYLTAEGVPEGENYKAVPFYLNGKAVWFVLEQITPLKTNTGLRAPFCTSALTTA